MRFKLEGGPFDGQEVDGADDATLPANIGFDRDGRTVVAIWPGVEGDLSAWNIPYPVIPPGFARESEFWTAHYRRSARVTVDGTPVFELFHEGASIPP